jgi:hypothetical protein
MRHIIALLIKHKKIINSWKLWINYVYRNGASFQVGGWHIYIVIEIKFHVNIKS